MSNKERIIEQVKKVRLLPNCPNMFDAVGVQRLANDNELYELVIFIEEHRDLYSTLIMTGDYDDVN